VAEKAEQTAVGILVHQPVYWQKVEKQEIQETRVTIGLFEDVRVKGKNN
jgi:hypothetical protein